MIVKKYTAFLNGVRPIPQRDVWIRSAWGDVPISYVQDHEFLTNATFFDVKVNKWETDKRAAFDMPDDVWIRIEIKRRDNVQRGHDDISKSSHEHTQILMHFDMDAPYGEMDYVYYLSLIAALMEIRKNTVVCDDDGKICGVDELKSEIERKLRVT